MKSKNISHAIITYFIAAVWLINGLFCKLLNLVPRHQLIVARILGNEYAGFLTKTIGTAEIVMAVWIISSFKPRLCAVVQMLIIATMNAIEFFKAPDLLLFGKINAFIALCFILLIYYTEFILQKKSFSNLTMFSFLKNHPFAVEAFFESSIVLTFAVPKEKLQPMLPACLELDSFNDKWAFIAVAMVQTKALRPKGFPEFLGNNFFLTGYRIFVRYINTEGKRLRGLYILKSETNKKKMEFLGNIFTHYNYTTTDIIQSQKGNAFTIQSIQSKLAITIKTHENEISLPENSPFTSWKEARKFAGPLPFTFTFNSATKEVLIIEGVRQNWQPIPVEVTNYQIPFLESLHIGQALLANAFIIQHIPYYWKKGKIEKWKN